jgi:hypothetical protein
MSFSPAYGPFVVLKNLDRTLRLRRKAQLQCEALKKEIKLELEELELEKELKELRARDLEEDSDDYSEGGSSQCYSKSSHESPNPYSVLSSDNMDYQDDVSEGDWSSLGDPPPKEPTPYRYKFVFGLPKWNKYYTSTTFRRNGRKPGKELQDLPKARPDGLFQVWTSGPSFQWAQAAKRLESEVYDLCELILSRTWAKPNPLIRVLERLRHQYDGHLGYLRYPKGYTPKLPKGLRRLVFLSLRVLRTHSKSYK